MLPMSIIYIDSSGTLLEIHVCNNKMDSFNAGTFRANSSLELLLSDGKILTQTKIKHTFINSN